jgi:hypothetical protein
MKNAEFDQGNGLDEAGIKVITDILREMHLSRSDPIATIIARNVIRYAQAGVRDPARLRELATEFLRE